MLDSSGSLSISTGAGTAIGLTGEPPAAGTWGAPSPQLPATRPPREHSSFYYQGYLDGIDQICGTTPLPKRKRMKGPSARDYRAGKNAGLRTPMAGYCIACQDSDEKSRVACISSRIADTEAVVDAERIESAERGEGPILTDQPAAALNNVILRVMPAR